MNDNKLERQINDAASEAISVIESLEDRISELEGENSDLQDIISEKEDRIGELEEEIEELKEVISELEKGEGDLQEEIYVYNLPTFLALNYSL